MKKTIIATIVGGLILFIWQFLSWAMLNNHYSQNSYTAYQDKILKVLDEINLAEGEYVLPTVKHDASEDERVAYMEKAEGQPWAILKYRKKLEYTMGMNMFRGVVMNMFIVLGLCFFINTMRKRDFKSIFLVCLGFGLLSYLIHPYLYSIWFQTNTIPDLIDAVVQFSLLGGWLGFMLKDKA